MEKFYNLGARLLIMSHLVWIYHISSVIRQEFVLQKQSQKFRSILQDGSRYLGLFRKSTIHIIAKFHRTDLVICSHSREGKPCLIAEKIWYTVCTLFFEFSV